MSIEATRYKILEVANRLFTRYGFHKASMDEIAKTARKAKGSLYYHFASKEELFQEVVSKEFEDLKAQLRLIIENDELDAPAKFKKYLIKRMEILNHATNYHETLKADFYEHFDFMDDLREEFTEWEKKSIKKIISQGVEEKKFMEVENMEVLLNILILVLKSIEVPLYIHGEYETYASYSDSLINIINKGLAP